MLQKALRLRLHGPWDGGPDTDLCKRPDLFALISSHVLLLIKTYDFPSVRAVYQDALSEAQILRLPNHHRGERAGSELAENLHRDGREIEYWPFVCVRASLSFWRSDPLILRLGIELG